MTTARVLAPREPQMRVVAALKALRAARDIPPDDLAHAAGMGRATWFKRLADGQFTIGQVIALADFLGVSVQDLVDGKLSVSKIRPNPFRALAGGGTDPVPRSPLMQPLPGLPPDNALLTDSDNNLSLN